LNAGEEYKK
jgi:hypothetical protein